MDGLHRSSFITTYHVLAFLQRWPHPFGPTLREIADGCYFAYPSSVVRHLDRLEAWGLVERTPGKARALALTKKGHTFDISRRGTGADGEAETKTRATRD